MKQHRLRKTHTIIIAALFGLAAVINVWRIFAEGPHPLIVIAAICFIAATIIWLGVAFRLRGDR
jgi:hypothetical protein